jgi:predicted enzyme related to lactoylglutathione lyase
MPEVTKYEPGNFCWPELVTSDADGAKKFYGGLFGWAAEDSPAGPDMVYTMLKKKGRSVGALYRMRPEQKGMPPNWGVYIAVASADESARKAGAAGAKTFMAPFDVMDVGRMAVLQDPQGAVFSVWEARKHIGTELVGEPGTPCWAELDTNDPAAAEKFYTAVFPWKAKKSPEYTEWQLGDKSIGGMMKIPKEWGPVPPNWLVYFMVEDVDASTEKAKQLGASPMVPPTDIPNTGRFSVVKDPQGAVFAVFKPSM